MSPVGKKFNLRIPKVIVLPNVDDDDLDGVRDCDDEKINGIDDLEDLSHLNLDFDRPARIIAHDSEVLNIFYGSASKSQSDLSLTDTKFETHKNFYFEAKAFASKDRARDFALELWVEYEDKSTISLKVPVSITPFVLLPNAAQTEEFYIATGSYNNSTLLSELEPVLQNSNVIFHKPYLSYKWRNMWVQDTFEIGYTQLPGRPPMHVVLNGIRGSDEFGPKLLSRNIGLIKVGKRRALASEDRWADWFGNLEVTPPTVKYPLGRIIYGKNQRTGVGLHPDVVAFLVAQKVQPPFHIDTSFLVIKHVDEIVSFVADGDQKYHMIIASPEKAAELLSSDLSRENKKVQKILNRIREKIIKEIGFDRDSILELPLLIKNGLSIWSNPINSVFLNGSVLFGKTYMPSIVRNHISDQLSSIGLESIFLTDKVYHDNLGNLHCSSNTRKKPLLSDFSPFAGY